MSLCGIQKIRDEALDCWRKYAGAIGQPMSYQQRLYDRAMRLSRKVAKAYDMELADVVEQLCQRGANLGAIRSQPGKDY